MLQLCQSIGVQDTGSVKKETSREIRMAKVSGVPVDCPSTCRQGAT